MRILCLLSTFPPDKNGCALAEELFLKKLSKKHKLNIIAFVREAFIKKEFEPKKDSIKLIRFNSLLIRYLQMFLSSLKYIKYADIIYADTFCGPLAIRLGKWFGKKVILKNHGVLEKEKSNPLFLKELINGLKQADKVIAVSEVSKQKLIDTGILKEKISIVPNMVDLSLFKDIGLKSRDIILFVGPLNLDVKVRGIKVLIDALEGLNQELWIIGDGQKRKDLEEYIKDKDVSVKLLGYIEHKILPYYYSRAKIFVLPSFSENMPLVILEAMACGAPVIATNVGYVPRMVDNKKTGILVNPGDKNELKDAITYLDENPLLRKKISQNTKKAMKKPLSLNIEKIFLDTKNRTRIAYITYGNYENWSEGSTRNYNIVSRLINKDTIEKVYLFGFSTNRLGIKNNKIKCINLKSIGFPPFKTLQSSVLIFIKLLKLLLKNQIDLIYERDSLHSLGVGLKLGKIFKKSVIQEVNGNVVEELKILGFKNRFLLNIVEKMELNNLKQSDAVIAVSFGLKNILLKRGVPGEKAYIIPNGVDIDLFRPIVKDLAIKKTGLQNKPTICFIGSFTKWQGLEQLFYIFSKVIEKISDSQLILIGDGEERENLERLVYKLNINKNVNFLGRMPQKKIPDYINSSNLCILFRTNFNEMDFSPLKLYEYLACEKPVITNNLSCFNFLQSINAGKNVDLNDFDAASNEFVSLLKNKKQAMQMGKHGRKFVIENRYTWNSAADKTIEIMRRLA